MKKNTKKLNIYFNYLDLMFQKLIKLLELKRKVGRDLLKTGVKSCLVNIEIVQIYLREKIGLNN